ncbi:pentatricopeptide repeat-containing protein At4g22760-like [Rhododendron vialii]|uniref:pentatricopeptide repeat-containing protein At4g22760-like n=1 Tax=Rhododendron vialii TaxID=182163 RepID=UPI00265DDE2A|nr:pentatricopeptide repeat-containing protein At4g22760-like [Rhododendron vialii]
MVVSKLGALLNNPLTLNQANQIYALILTSGLNHLQPLLIRQLLVPQLSYSQPTTQYLRLILSHMQDPNVFSWSCTIRFLSLHNQFREAFNMYVEMHRLGLCPNTFSLSSSLKACGRIGYKIGGVSIHAQVHKHGFCKVVYVQTALVDFYSKVGCVEIARKVFDEMLEKNVVSWNSILSGYMKSGNLAVARSMFDEMPEKDVISWNSMVSGYGREGDMEQACALFRQMPERNVASWNAMISGYLNSGKVELARSFFEAMPRRNNVSLITMISGYSKCGDVESAKDLFDHMGEKDLLLYNAMIACYAQNSRSKEALQLFNKMIQPNVNIQPDKMTFASVLSACSQLGDMTSGSWIESYMKQLGIQIDDHLATALIDLYAKCGSIDKAYKLFQLLQKKDLVSYSAMILGCGLNGRAKDAITLFEQMMEARIFPNLITVTGILTAYNHFVLVEEGYKCFNLMQKHYELVLSADHYGIMVDMLGRAGRLEEAYELIKSMPMQPHAGVWGALLLACSVHSNLKIGEIAAKHCFELEPDVSGYRSLLSSIYASVGRWDDAKSLREGLQKKIPGCSWMEQS